MRVASPRAIDDFSALSSGRILCLWRYNMVLRYIISQLLKIRSFTGMLIENLPKFVTEKAGDWKYGKSAKYFDITTLSFGQNLTVQLI
jgi:hypothetical protein